MISMSKDCRSQLQGRVLHDEIQGKPNYPIYEESSWQTTNDCQNVNNNFFITKLEKHMQNMSKILNTTAVLVASVWPYQLKFYYTIFHSFFIVPRSAGTLQASFFKCLRKRFCKYYHYYSHTSSTWGKTTNVRATYALSIAAIQRITKQHTTKVKKNVTSNVAAQWHLVTRAVNGILHFCLLFLQRWK